jgi:acyl carrier protein
LRFGCTAGKLNVPSGSLCRKGVVLMPEGATKEREALRRIVADALQLPLESVPLDAKSQTIESWDSLRHLDIVMAIEAATGVGFSIAEIVELTSLERIEAALLRHGWNAN